MNTARKISTARTGKRLASAAVTTLFASTILALAPTAASAFDIGGLIGTAMALRYGGYHVSPYHHHVVSGRDRDSTGGDATGVERDARDVDASNQAGKSESRVTAHSYGSGQRTSQASERDASAGEVASSAKTFNDAPVFNPTR